MCLTSGTPAASHLKKGCSPEKKSCALPGIVDFHPCSPLCPKLPVSRCKTWAGMRPLKLNTIYHSKPCAHFMLITLEGSPLRTAR